MYAYTDSNLQVALLGLFTELLYRYRESHESNRVQNITPSVFHRFPNLVVGVLTRDSVRQALRGGITADQIISYLEQHAHPNVSQFFVSVSSKIHFPEPQYPFPDASSRTQHQFKVTAATDGCRSNKIVGKRTESIYVHRGSGVQSISVAE